MKKTLLLLIWMLTLAAALVLFAQSERPEEQVNPLAGNRQAIAAGTTRFAENCAICHGTDAKGERGPSLVSGVFPHGAADGQIFLSIRSGIARSAMPAFPQLSSDQVWQIIAFLRNLAGTAPTVRSSSAEGVAGDAAAGKQVVEGKGACLTCHVVNGIGKSIGPDLSAAGNLPAQQIQAKIMNPNQPAAAAAGGGLGGGGGGGGRGRGGAATPATITVRTKDGHEYRGIRKSADSVTVAMVDTNGMYRSFDRASGATIQITNSSLMPDDFAKRLTPAEIQDVVAYLKTLDGKDLTKLAAGDGVISWDRLRNAEKNEPQNYTSYWGGFSGQHFSQLTQINNSNVKNLQAKWSIALAGTGSTEAIPLVVDGIMYTVSPVVGQLEILAIDAKSGKVLWRYDRKQKVVNPNEINRHSRGVTVAGNRVFFGTLDAALVALDARTGAFLWETQIADTMKGYSLTSPPLPVKDKVITGISGGEFGINGFIEAYDQATGKKIWRFNTVPQPGEPGHETWAGDSWKTGGAPTWLTGSYDVDADTLIWSVGNPGPDMNGDVRLGDNLYSSSVVALNPDTGKLKWHYQFTPNDTHDWDSTEDMVLVDRIWHGAPHKLLLHADRNGIFYVLDRTNGKFLAGYPFVRATWVKGWDENGKPITTENWRSSPTGNLVFPALGGGSNFQAPSYSSVTGWMYFMYHDGPGSYSSGDAPFEEGRQYSGRGAGGGGGAAQRPPDPPPSDGAQAFDPETGKTMWKHELTSGGLSPGLMATAGNVVFACTSEGNFLALDAKTGQTLWHFTVAGSIGSSPMSYAVDGKQYVAVSAAGVLYSFALPD